jgi:hypothetical protein
MLRPSTTAIDGVIAMIRRVGPAAATVFLVVVAALVGVGCSSQHRSASTPITGSGPSQTPQERAHDLVTQARDDLGADFTDDQISCMADYAVAHPVMLERGAGADGGVTAATDGSDGTDQSKDLMAMVLGCVPKDQFVGYLLASIGQAGSGTPSLSPAQESCMRSGLGSLTSDQLVAMVTDPTAQAQLVGAVTPCLDGSTTTVAPAGQ